jgi:hypothetical protein
VGVGNRIQGNQVMLKNIFNRKSKPMSDDEMTKVVERLTGLDLSQLLNHAEGITLQLSKGDQVLFTGEYIADDWFGKTYLKEAKND